MQDWILSPNSVIYAAYVLMFVAVFLVSKAFFEEQQSRELQENLDELKDRKASSGLLRLTRPYFTQYIVPIVRNKTYLEGLRKTYRRKLITAGLKNELTPDELLAYKIFLIFFFPIALGILNSLELIDVGMFVIVGAGCFGWFYPDLWINSRIQKRQLAVIRSFPFVIDLLAVSTEAGLDFAGAMQKVVEKAKNGPLIDEFEQVLKEIRIGASRAEALREMAYRVDLPEVTSFVAVLISADAMGASIGKILKQQSESVRNDRMVKAEKAGAAAQPKIIVATIIFILPAVMLLIAGPFVLSMM